MAGIEHYSEGGRTVLRIEFSIEAITILFKDFYVQNGLGLANEPIKSHQDERLAIL
jgi:hypothetical protein